MSTGERSIVMTIIKMLYSMMENKNKSIVFYMDEPDVFLHPEWQRRLIDALATVTRRTLPKRLESNLHIDQNKPIVSIVTTTHSPIIISDIPRENIIALDKTGKDGKIQRASLEHETFLNNLFANYADAFHVESFLGEYARKKFATKTKAGDKDFLDIIGDDFLQNYMKHK